jgi:hypothetical protein
MVQAEIIDSRRSSFQLDDGSRCDHHSLAHLSKFTLSGAGTPPPRLILLSNLAAGRRPGSLLKVNVGEVLPVVVTAQQARDELRRVVGFSAADEIQKLDALKKAGSISDAEFARLRARLV